MAPRKQNWHSEETRQKIQTSQLINRLTNHAFGKAEMSSTQVQAALGLLKKSLPDLQAVSMEAQVSGVIRYERVNTGVPRD